MEKLNSSNLNNQEDPKISKVEDFKKKINEISKKYGIPIPDTSVKIKQWIYENYMDRTGMLDKVKDSKIDDLIYELKTAITPELIKPAEFFDGNNYDGENQDDFPNFKSQNYQFNNALDGGFKCGTKYNICGETLTGKTLLLNSILENNVDNHANTIYFIDGQRSNLKYGFPPKPNFKYLQVKDTKELNETLDKILKEERDRIAGGFKGKYLLLFDGLISAIELEKTQENKKVINEFHEKVNNLVSNLNACVIMATLAWKPISKKIYDAENNSYFRFKKYIKFLFHWKNFFDCTVYLYKFPNGIPPNEIAVFPEHLAYYAQIEDTRKRNNMIIVSI